MPIVSFIIFFATFTFIILVGLYIVLIFYNNRTAKTTSKFISQVNDLNPTIFNSIKIRYRTMSGLKNFVYPSNHCDLYLFDNYLAIVRRKDFVFKVNFAPILLTSNIATRKNNFDYLDIYKPDCITLKQIVIGEVEIKMTDPNYKHYKIEITLKGLTNEQTNQLYKIKNWC